MVAPPDRQSERQGRAPARSPPERGADDESRPPPELSTKRQFATAVALALLSGAGTFGVLFRLDCRPLELAKVLLGLGALWLPMGSLVYALTRDRITDSLDRFTFSAIASYALTTLCYFVLAVCARWIPGCERLFYFGEAALLFGVIVHWWRERRTHAAPPKAAALGRVDFVLIALIVASVGVTLRYKIVYELAPDGGRDVVADGDQAYYASLVYELERHVPPLHQSIRGGQKERAYHLFPHLTTMLVARFTGQRDVLRAHLVYEYMWIETAMCLALFCMARTLTRSRWAGYLAIALLHILAIPLPPLKTNTLGYFYFTLHPQATSSIEPFLFTSPQGYSGMLVTWGLFLGVLWMSPRIRDRRPLGALVVVSALLVAAMMRFRVQIFLPLLAPFLAILVLSWMRTREQSVALAAGCLVVVGAALFLEMRTPVYHAGTAQIIVGNNGLTFAPFTQWLNAWPWSGELRAFLEKAIRSPAALGWVWQFTSLSMFTFCNVVGIPSLVLAGAFLRSGPARREWAVLGSLVVALVVLSIAGGACFSTSYDVYSVGGQMPLNAGWYLLPFTAVGTWSVLERWHGNPPRWPAAWAAGAFWVTVAVATGWQLLRPPSRLESLIQSQRLMLEADEWAMLMYARDHLPPEAVVLMAAHSVERRATFSAIAGQRGYLEYGVSSVVPELAEETRRRIELMGRIRTTASGDEMCRLLAPTPITHLVEYADEPLSARNPPCLKSIFAAPRVTLWEVER